VEKMASGYTFQKYNKELMARAMGRHLAISTKQSIEICNRIRNKPLRYAKQLLSDAIGMKRPIAYTRFNGDIGHKPGMAAGRYPIKTAQNILGLLKNAEANAQTKGLNTGSLYVIHSNAQKGARPMHQGRQRGTAMKRTHVEIILQERAEEQKKKVQKKPQQKAEEVKPKVAEEKVEKKVEPTLQTVEEKVENKETATPKETKPEVAEEKPEMKEENVETPNQETKPAEKPAEEKE
jgi:large subunit ribosomal protein L22